MFFLEEQDEIPAAQGADAVGRRAGTPAITLRGLVPGIHAVVPAGSPDAGTTRSRTARKPAFRHGVDARDKPGQGDDIPSTGFAAWAKNFHPSGASFMTARRDHS
jgi:hypothetical protein